MNILDYKHYHNAKLAFMHKHYDDFSVDTSPMSECGTYHKTYIFEDGAQMTEVMRPVYVNTVVEVRGVKIPIRVKLFETEMWTSDDANSVFYYEKFNHEKEAEI